MQKTIIKLPLADRRWPSWFCRPLKWHYPTVQLFLAVVTYHSFFFNPWDTDNKPQKFLVWLSFLVWLTQQSSPALTSVTFTMTGCSLTGWKSDHHKCPHGPFQVVSTYLLSLVAACQQSAGSRQGHDSPEGQTRVSWVRQGEVWEGEEELKERNEWRSDDI